MSDTPTVVEAISRVMGDVQAIRKADRNEQQRFLFRGIDAVMNAVGPALRAHGVVVVPLAEELTSETYQTAKGTAMRNATIRIRWRFHGPAGDWIEAVSIGEAADSGDKAVSKAHSVAYRTVLLQALCIPTDEPDPDASSHERATRETDLAWMEAFDARIAAASSVDEVRALWREHTEVYDAGRLTDEDRDLLRKALTARKDELTPAEAAS